MYLPPKTYEKRANRIGAVRMARNWLTRDITPEGMVKFYHDVYKKCGKDADEQRKVLAIMAYCMSLADDDFAIRAAKMAGIDWTPGRGVGESIAIFLEEKYGGIPWRVRFNPGFRFEENLADTSGRAVASHTASEQAARFLLHIGDVDRSRIDMWRSPDGGLNLCVTNQFDDSILIDEEPFSGEPPLYFSEHTHFLSPVCVANVTRRVLASVLELAGYPPVAVRAVAWFSNPNACFVNADDYSECTLANGWHWDGVDVHMAHSFHGPVVTAAIPLSVGAVTHETPMSRQDGILFQAIGATAFIIRSLEYSEWTGFGLNTSKIRSRLREYGLI